MQVKARGVLASVFPGGAMVMTNAHAGDSEDMASIPGWRRSPGGGHGKTLQYSCLGSPMDRVARRATVHGVAKSQT